MRYKISSKGEQLRKGLLLFGATLLLTACNQTIKKEFETKTEKVTIKTFVKDYSSRNKAYSGTISICNTTADTIRFNFNQSLIVEDQALMAGYNSKSIPYPCEAFEIKPNDCSTWDVIWKTEKEISSPGNIDIKADTVVILSTCKPSLQN